MADARRWKICQRNSVQKHVEIMENEGAVVEVEGSPLFSLCPVGVAVEL